MWNHLPEILMAAAGMSSKAWLAAQKKRAIGF